jgi:hypothetical protein
VIFGLAEAGASAVLSVMTTAALVSTAMAPAAGETLTTVNAVGFGVVGAAADEPPAEFEVPEEMSEAVPADEVPAGSP